MPMWIKLLLILGVILAITIIGFYTAVDIFCSTSEWC